MSTRLFTAGWPGQLVVRGHGATRGFRMSLGPAGSSRLTHRTAFGFAARTTRCPCHPASCRAWRFRGVV